MFGRQLEAIASRKLQPPKVDVERREAEPGRVEEGSAIPTTAFL
jgi:hypothetical protein